MVAMQDTGSTSGRLIAGSKVAGTDVFDTRGERLGRVEDVMIDKPTGRIVYAVLSFGGFLGIGDRHYPVPWNALHYDTSLGGYVAPLDRRLLEGAPSFEAGSSPAWESEDWGRSVYAYYGKDEPYSNVVP